MSDERETPRAKAYRIYNDEWAKARRTYDEAVAKSRHTYDEAMLRRDSDTPTDH